MIIIACVNKQNGMSYYGRHPTKDRLVHERILQDVYLGIPPLRGGIPRKMPY